MEQQTAIRLRLLNFLGITLRSLRYRLAKHRMEDEDGEDEEVLEEANEL